MQLYYNYYQGKKYVLQIHCRYIDEYCKILILKHRLSAIYLVSKVEKVIRTSVSQGCRVNVRRIRICNGSFFFFLCHKKKSCFMQIYVVCTFGECIDVLLRLHQYMYREHEPKCLRDSNAVQSHFGNQNKNFI